MKILTTLMIVFLTASTTLAQDRQESTLSETDQLQIAVQKICPVTGSELGSMGDPVKVMVGEQVAFLCCAGCQGKQMNGELWGTIQANIAKAQGICPIMEQAVDATMESTIVEGQKIFVCCPPCIAKIQADAKGSLAKVTASYVAFVAAEHQVASDKLHIAAQKICPVSGQELGSMGEPIKIKVGEKEHAFLCCASCQGKQINAEHWKTIQTNLSTAQGTCPVMDKAVDATMKSTVVNGRKIFVCCPPCIEKIDAEPAKFVAMLDSQIAANLKLKETAGDHKSDR